jgi:hypothetical protein
MAGHWGDCKCSTTTKTRTRRRLSHGWDMFANYSLARRLTRTHLSSPVTSSASPALDAHHGVSCGHVAAQ